MTIAQKHHSFAPPHRLVHRPKDYMANGPAGPWLKLADDGWFDFADPDYSQWSWRGTATALAKIPRFNGNTGTVYSVAQHSVYVHDHVPEDQPDIVKFYALIHDAPEAVLGDRVQPLKLYEACTTAFHFDALAKVTWHHTTTMNAKSSLLRDLHLPENWLLVAMNETTGKWSLQSEEEKAIVKEIDERALVTEMRDLNFQPQWGLGLSAEREPYEDLILPHSNWRDSYAEFLDRLSRYVDLETIR